MLSLSSSSLSQQKYRLALLFSLSIFSIITILDIGFISFKYFNSAIQELNRLSFQAQNIKQILEDSPIFLENILQGKSMVMPMNILQKGKMMNTVGGRQGGRPKIQIDNFFLYSKQDGKILFSPQKNDEVYASILTEVQSQTKEGERYFHFNESKYLFVNTSINTTIGVIVFAEAQMTDEDMIFDILIYLLGAITLSLGVYAISYRFVDNTLSPVEKSMEQMEQFVHNAGHELKTPLSVIKSSLELMRLKKNYEEGISESIGELDRMNGLIQALISLSTIGDSDNIESINVPEIFDKLEKNYKKQLEEKEIVLRIIQKKTPQVKANREYTEILLSNLLGNAIKYNHQKGSITVTIDQKRVTIQDTGRGIEKENLSKVFDRFFQEETSRSIDSFGIGLSLVKRIAALYKWQIHLESEKGVGTTVKIEF